MAMRPCKFRPVMYMSATLTRDEAGNLAEVPHGDPVPTVSCECGGHPHLRVTVPGTILCPWDADFSRTYCGPEAEASNLRIAVAQYHAAAAHVDDLLRDGGVAVTVQ